MSFKKPSRAKCALCSAQLHAVPKRSQGELSKLAKTEKRPQRVFGGVLCANCTRRVLKEKTRLKHKVISENELDLLRVKYAKALRD